MEDNSIAEQRAAINELPLVMAPGQSIDQPYSTIPFPIFFVQPRIDFNRQIKEFLTSSNANKARHESHWLAIFHGTLQGSARDWFNRHQPGLFATWTNLRDTSLESFRLIAFNGRLMGHLHDFIMNQGETIDFYNGRFSDIIISILQGQVVSNEERLQNFLKGLTPSRLRTSNTIFIEMRFFKVSFYQCA